MKLNLKSIFLSGIVAGLAIIVVGGCLVPLIGHQMDEVLKNRSLPPLSIGAMIYFAFNSIVFGIGAVGLYALMQAFISSKTTAILTTSITFWFFVYFLSNAALVAYGFMPVGLTAIGTSWGLIEVTIGVLIGSKLYRVEKITAS